MQKTYAEIYRAWKDDHHAHWREAARAIDWFTEPTDIFDGDQGVYGRWFPDARGNTCHNCVDRHVAAGRGEVAALIYDSPVTGRKARFTYAELLERVNAMAAVLVDQGVEQGDRVILYMPMIPEAIFAMLACARIGAIHSVVFGGFAASELAARIDDSTARLVVTASCGIEPNRVVAYKPLLDVAIDLARHKPDRCLVLQRPELAATLQDGRDIDMGAALDAARGRSIPCAPLAATDPLYILYTSGTTGQPKGVIRDNGGHMVALAWTMQALYGVKPGEVYWAASDIGWVVGHSYIVYAPLLNGSTTVLYEGKPIGTPDAGAFWRVVEEYKVSVLFTAPTAFRAIRKEDPEGALVKRHDLSSLRALFLAGERADPDTLRWAEAVIGVPVIDHWWQTETGWAIVGNPLGLDALPVKHGSPTVPMPGYDLHVLDDAGHEVTAGTLGNIAIKLPLPPGCLPSFWNADERFRTTCLSEFPGYYKTADAGYVDDDGYVFIMSRTDDIINVAGHRLSTGAIEEVCAGHPDVAECAVIGVADDIKGQVPAGFLVLKSNVSRESSLVEAEVVGLVREKIGPVAAFKTAICVKRLPKTRSGKILRGTMQKIADREEWKMPATIDDPAILDEIAEVLTGRKIG
ncbi:propionyl-CoA synthetase [Shinella curvata]|uniref:Propionyl-CoA synthetase n=1 Tax=Shinella curvata TaxID=1817964 RepID=A0ABT8XKU4_9HYPH|nr:propionyl-CoA synthetase [Shinella curvata]MCJ8056483.1 propionyl-CoA synthetase [Shinella curvata]MDO6124361.1 propionyl-CoA synthetase [Shinella curvata]